VPGRRLVYEIEGRTEILTPPAPPSVGNMKPVDTGNKVVAAYTQTATMRLTTLGVDESGGAAFALVFLKVKNVMTVDGKTDSLELSAPDAPIPADKEPGAGEKPAKDAPADEHPAQTVTNAMIGAAIRIDIRADGTVSSVAGLEQAAEVAANAGPHGDRVLGAFAPAVVERTIAGLFRLDTPGATSTFAARNTGDTWQVVDRSRLGKFGDMVTTAAMRLEACADGSAKVAGDIHVDLEPRKPAPGEATDPGTPQLFIDEQAGSLTAAFDCSSGTLLSRVRDMTVATSEKLGSVRVPTQRTHNKLEFKLIEKSEP
jgi:hypothetical protein